MNAALLNHLWQSSAFLLLAVLLAACLRRHPARLRFWVWQAASLKFLVPFAALAWVAVTPQWRPVAVAPAAAVRMAQPFSNNAPDARFSPLSAPLPSHADRVPWLFLLWLVGCLAVFAVWLRRWSRVGAARRSGRPVAGQMPTVITDASIEPGVFGIVRPVLLLPADLATRLTPEQMQAVLAHELCHARRRDNLWSALHQLVTALFWFFPPVWWLGSRLVAERERACDEAVLFQGADAESYAAGVLQVCRYYACAPAACAAGVSGGDLARRVRGILGYAGLRRLSRPAQVGFAALLLAALAAPIAGRHLFAQQAAKPQFDAATIQDLNGAMWSATAGLQYSPGRLYASCVSLGNLASFAYELKGQETITGKPDWWNPPCNAAAPNYNIFQFQATFPADTPDAQVREMMQAFLADRFKLSVHWESKPMPVYDLVVAPGGLKIKPSDPEKDPPITRADNTCPVGAPHCVRWCCGSQTMDGLARSLSNVRFGAGRPVFDMTGLSGYFYFDRYAWGGDDPSDVPLPTLPDVLHDQFGLDLKPATGPVPVLVIEHVEKLNRENETPELISRR